MVLHKRSGALIKIEFSFSVTAIANNTNKHLRVSLPLPRLQIHPVLWFYSKLPLSHIPFLFLFIILSPPLFCASLRVVALQSDSLFPQTRRIKCISVPQYCCCSTQPTPSSKQLSKRQMSGKELIVVQWVNVAAAAWRCAEDESGGLEESERERERVQVKSKAKGRICVFV